MDPVGKIELMKVNNACYGCLETGHRIKGCQRGFKCRVTGCRKNHNDLLHEAYISNCSFHTQKEIVKGIVNSILQ